MDLIVLKLGGSVITRKSDDVLEVNEDNLRRLSNEIAEAMSEKQFRLFIVHGAGPFGHVLAKEYRLSDSHKDARQIKGFSLTHQSMEALNSMVVATLLEAGLNAVSYQPSAAGVLKSGRIDSMDLKPLKGMIDLGLIPVGYGDVLVDEDDGLNILSGDHLVPHVALGLKASRVIIITDYNGVFAGDPGGSEKLDEITRENVDILDGRKTSGTDVTGGIRGKVMELLDLADEGVESEIISGNEKDYLKMALLGERGLGTIVK
ncbi:MAG: isopentenyl phosphate kinase [Candidatus Altiarchaeota archaeon]